MIPSNSRIEILAIRVLLCAGTKGVKRPKDALFLVKLFGSLTFGLLAQTSPQILSLIKSVATDRSNNKKKSHFSKSSP